MDDIGKLMPGLLCILGIVLTVVIAYFFESTVGAGIGLLIFVVGLVWYLMPSDN